MLRVATVLVLAGVVQVRATYSRADLSFVENLMNESILILDTDHSVAVTANLPLPQTAARYEIKH